MNPCLCIPLRTGALVIGILEIVLYSLSALLYGFAVAGVAYVHGNNHTEVEADVELKEAQAPDVNKALHEDVTGVFVILTLITALSLIQLIVGVVLVLGVKRSSQTLLRTWMGFKILVVMFSIGMLLVSVTRNYGNAKTISVDVFSTVVGTYFLLVVGAHSQELTKSATGSTAVLHESFMF